jgi:hypothetical protein
LDELEEALQPAIGRSDKGSAGALGGEMAEVDGARTDHGNDDRRLRLDPVLVQPKMWPQGIPEGGDGTVKHEGGPVCKAESPTKSPFAALNHPYCRVELTITDLFFDFSNISIS